MEPSTLTEPRVDAADDAHVIRQSLAAPERFGVVYERHVGAIFRFVALRVGPAAAEDIVAETFAIAFDRRRRFRVEATSARPWLYGIAANRLHQHRDAEARWLRRQPGIDPTHDDDGASLDARLDAIEVRPRLLAALALLTPGERDVLLLHALGQLDHSAIAAALGIRRGASKTRLSRATTRLRSLLGPAFDDQGADHE